MIMIRLLLLSSFRWLKNVTVRAASAGNTTMPRSVPPGNLRCSIQQEHSHGSVQKGSPSTSLTRSTAVCWKISFHQGISTKTPNGILRGQCGVISPFFRKEGFIHWTGLPQTMHGSLLSMPPRPCQQGACIIFCAMYDSSTYF